MKLNVSIIIPFYKKLDDFKYALNYNKHQFEKVNEVILICDEIVCINNFVFLKEYNINFKFFTNTENHQWRNPAVVINHGIKQAISDYIIILSPETILMENAIIHLVKNTNNTNYCIGRIVFTNKKTFENNNMIDLLDTSKKNKNKIAPLYYGSICCSKKNLQDVNYYSETFNKWGGEDDDVRIKLIKNGINQIKLDTVNAFHIESTSNLQSRLVSHKYKYNGVIDKKYYIEDTSLYNNFIEFNIEPININNNFSSFIDYKLKENIYSYYPIILLTQSYNEETHVKDFLNNVNNFVDGIIVLDDNSTDNTWNLLEHEKILLKVKKERITFNDIENRNLLLNLFENLLLKNNIRVDWFVWLDFDERIDDNINIINYLRTTLLSSKNKNNIYTVPLVHMWNDIEYNGSYPYSDNGVQKHIRLIRNKLDKLPYVLKCDRTLHFRLNPYIDIMEDNYNQLNFSLKEIKYNTFPLIIKHLGRNSQELRNYKYNLYKNVYDSNLVNQSSYEHFLNNNINYINFEDNRYYLFYKMTNSLLPVIIYYNDSYINKIKEYFNDYLPGSIFIEYNNIIPDWIDKDKHIVLLINMSGNSAINIKRILDEKYIITVGNNILNNELIVFKNNKEIICSISIMNGHPLGVIQHKIDYRLLYPANIKYQQRLDIEKLAINEYKNNNCNEYAICYFSINNNDIKFIKINTMPIISSCSLYTTSALCVGIKYTELFVNLINNALIRHKYNYLHY